MKQVLQNLKNGRTEVVEVPCPAVGSGEVLIRSSRTLVSAGTEGMLVAFGRASLFGKARAQPDKVRQVLEKMRVDGVLTTIDAVFNKLEQPLPLGYCNVGVVVETGRDVTSFVRGERVVSNGKHAEMVSVPKNLCVRVPDAVSDDEAAFAVLGAIALQGIRLVQPTLGEAVVVTGLGLIGLLSVQLLRAHGCRVLGLDFDPHKLEIARSFGAEVVNLSAGEDPVHVAKEFSRGRGVDAVMITAATTSNEPVHQAALMSRKRGRIVLVGVAGLELSRADFYEKELSFQVSCSYGPGRYDPTYEEKGIDYPAGFVRWTEQRNIEAILDMMADRRLDVGPLVSHRFPIADTERAYHLVGGEEPSLGIVFEYDPDPAREATLRLRTVQLTAPVAAKTSRSTGASLGVIGAGNYATAVLLPAFQAAGAHLHTIASSGGVSGVHAGRKFGFDATTTDVGSVLADPDVNSIVIATRHNTHARLTCDALRAGKHVFVEKPLALTSQDLADIEDARSTAPGTPMVMVGFNRRFAPHVRKMKELLGTVRDPKVLLITVNAGAIPAAHWTQDPAVGGGRIVGEACHFIDLLRFLAGTPISHFTATRLGKREDDSMPADNAAITLTFADGSLGTIVYTAEGHKAYPKERVEVFAAGRVLKLDNFRSLTAVGWPRFKSMKLLRQDKGQRACAAAFVHAIASGGGSPIPFDELLEVSRVTIDVAESLR